MSGADAAGAGTLMPLTPAMGAAYARAVHGVALSDAEARWLIAEMTRGAAAVAQAARDVALADVRMAGFDALLQGEKG